MVLWQGLDIYICFDLLSVILSSFRYFHGVLFWLNAMIAAASGNNYIHCLLIKQALAYYLRC